MISIRCLLVTEEYLARSAGKSAPARLPGMRRISRKAESFTESVIREMNRLAVQAGAVSLAQASRLPGPDRAQGGGRGRAVRRRQPVRDRRRRADAPPGHRRQDGPLLPSWEPDPDTEITVVCGATEGMIAAMLGLLDPGDEVIVFEPFYENYGPDAILTGATPRYVTLHEPDWAIDPDELRAAVTPRTRAIVVNSPHNPTGKVFRRDELELIANLCLEHDLLAFTDDIYEHIVFEGEHIPLATLPGMADRTVAINSMSKTYSVTGWRGLGDRLARAERRRATRPRLPDRRRRRATAGGGDARDDLPGRLLRATRRRLPRTARHAPAGSGRRRVPDPRTRRRLLRDDRHPGSHLGRRRHVRHAPDRRPRHRGGTGVVVLLSTELGRTKLRFAFPKRLETLHAAAERISRIATRPSAPARRRSNPRRPRCRSASRPRGSSCAPLPWRSGSKSVWLKRAIALRTCDASLIGRCSPPSLST